MVREGRKVARQTAQKPKSYSAYSFPGPTLGLMAMNNLAVAVPGSAAVLENWFPTATGAVIRRGKQIYATLGAGDLAVTSLFSYVLGNQREFFGANENTIYNLTTVLEATNSILGTEDGDSLGTEGGDEIGWTSTGGLETMTGLTGGDWVVVQFATAGGTYLVGVNGADDSFVYDGTTFYPQVSGGVYLLDYDGGTVAFTEGDTLTGGTSAATATIVKVVPTDPLAPAVAGVLWLKDITGTFVDNEAITDAAGGAALANGVTAIVPGTNVTFAGTPGLTTADLSYVWVYKNRIWFVQKDSLDVWYLPVDSIAGELTLLPLGGVFGKGGHLIFGATWSQDVGDGLNALNAFITSEGEAAVYQGANPADANDWGIVGVYQTGKPMGAKAHVKVGGDIALASDIAFVPLSEALRTEYSELGSNSLSAPIEALWPEQVLARAGTPWHCALWTAKQMVVVGLPTVDSQPPAMLVMNSRTRKWAWFTNWGSTCLHVFNDRLFIGDTLGRVYEANVTGLDDGEPYTATYLPSFDQLDIPGHKTVSMVRAVLRGPYVVREQMTTHTDYTVRLPAAPAATTVSAPGVWGDPGSVWGQFNWGSTSAKDVQQNWRNQFGTGEVVSAGIQITSGAIVPLDCEVIRTDVLFTVGDPVT